MDNLFENESSEDLAFSHYILSLITTGLFPIDGYTKNGFEQNKTKFYMDATPSRLSFRIFKDDKLTWKGQNLNTVLPKYGFKEIQHELDLDGREYYEYVHPTYRPNGWHTNITKLCKVKN